MIGSSQQPFGQVQSSSHFIQMGGNNAPPNLLTQMGQVLQQHQQPPNLGEFIPNLPYQQPNVRTSNDPLNTTPQGGSNYQPGWSQPGGTYSSEAPQPYGNVPFYRGFNPSQQGGFAIPYTN
jgi:hypothetical protein